MKTYKSLNFTLITSYLILFGNNGFIIFYNAKGKFSTYMKTTKKDVNFSRWDLITGSKMTNFNRDLIEKIFLIRN